MASQAGKRELFCADKDLRHISTGNMENISPKNQWGYATD
jgi:hypothetical protein